jgi:peptide/nickel transport system permease protein
MTEPPAGATKHPGYWRLVWRRFRRHRSGMAGLCVFLLLVVVSAFTPLLAGGQPIVAKYKGDWYFPAVVQTFHKIPGASLVKDVPKPFRFPSFNPKRDLASGDVPDPDNRVLLWPLVAWDPNEADLDAGLEPPSSRHLLGTDQVGRDVLARMIHATPLAILIGFVSMGVAAVIGLTIGSVAGYKGGKWDLALSRLIEVFICVPAFYVILVVLTLAKEPSIWNVMVVLGVFGWTGIARYARAEFMKQKNLDYAIAARALGEPTRRIIFRHLLPNSLTPVLVVVAFGVANAIFVESGLSWLGFGVQPPTPTWGNILREGYNNLRVAPHLIFPPSVAIFVAVLTLNLIGDALRDVTDPRLTGSS